MWKHPQTWYVAEKEILNKYRSQGISKKPSYNLGNWCDLTCNAEQGGGGDAHYTLAPDQKVVLPGATW